MNEYRCTRIAPYQADCDGKFDVSARNGYYVRALTALDAIKIMVKRFPAEQPWGFTVEHWKTLSLELLPTSDNECMELPIQLIHPKLLKCHRLRGDGTQAPGCITLREWIPGEWVTHFYNLQSGGYFYGHYFTSLPAAEADFKQRVLEFGGSL